MKKRILSFILALSMMISVFPVGAFAADTGGSAAPAAAVQSTTTNKTLTLENAYSSYYPEGSVTGSQKVSGDGWSYEPGTGGLVGTLTISKTSTGSYQYDFTKINPLDSTSDAINSFASLRFNVVVTGGAELCAGVFAGAVTAQGGGKICGGVFAQKPTVEADGTMSEGYQLTFGTDGGADAYYLYAYGVNISWSGMDKAPTAYIVPNSDIDHYPVQLSLGSANNNTAWDVTVGGTQTVLNQWSGAQNVTLNGSKTTFTAVPLPRVETVTIQPLTRLVLDDKGWPLGTDEGTNEFRGYDENTFEYYGWNFDPSSHTLTVGARKNLSVDFGGAALNTACNLVVEQGSSVSNAALIGTSTVENEGTIENIYVRDRTVSGSGTFENCIFANGNLTSATGTYTDCLLGTEATKSEDLSCQTLTLRTGDWGNTTVTLANLSFGDSAGVNPDQNSGKIYFTGTPKLKLTLASGESLTSINGMNPYAYDENIVKSGNQVTFTPKANEDVVIITDKADEVPLKMTDGKPDTTGVPQVNGIYCGTGWTYDPTTPAGVGTLTITPYGNKYEYDFSKTEPLDPNSAAATAAVSTNLVVEKAAYDYTYDTVFIIGGMFKGTVLVHNGLIKGGVFAQKPTLDGESASMYPGYQLTFGTDDGYSLYAYSCEDPFVGSAGVGVSVYVVPNDSVPVKLTLDSTGKYTFWDVDVDGTKTWLDKWDKGLEYDLSNSRYVAYDNNSKATFILNTAFHSTTEVNIQRMTRLMLDSQWPMGTNGGENSYEGDGWSFDATSTPKTLTVGVGKNLSVDLGGSLLSGDCKLVVNEGSTVANAALQWNHSAGIENNGTLKDCYIADSILTGSGTFENCVFNSNANLKDTTGTYTNCLLYSSVTKNAAMQYQTLTLLGKQSAYVCLENSPFGTNGNIPLGSNDVVYFTGTPKLLITLARGENIQTINGKAPADYDAKFEDWLSTQYVFTPQGGDVLIITDQADTVPLKIDNDYNSSYYCKPDTTGVPKVNGIYYGTGWTYDPAGIGTLTLTSDAFQFTADSGKTIKCNVVVNSGVTLEGVAIEDYRVGSESYKVSVTNHGTIQNSYLSETLMTNYGRIDHCRWKEGEIIVPGTVENSVFDFEPTGLSDVHTLKFADGERMYLTMNDANSMADSSIYYTVGSPRVQIYLFSGDTIDYINYVSPTVYDSTAGYSRVHPNYYQFTINNEDVMVNEPPRTDLIIGSDGYPYLFKVAYTLDGAGKIIYTGDGWSYDGATLVLAAKSDGTTLHDFGGAALECWVQITASNITVKNAVLKNKFVMTGANAVSFENCVFANEIAASNTQNTTFTNCMFVGSKSLMTDSAKVTYNYCMFDPQRVSALDTAAMTALNLCRIVAQDGSDVEWKLADIKGTEVITGDTVYISGKSGIIAYPNITVNRDVFVSLQKISTDSFGWVGNTGYETLWMQTLNAGSNKLQADDELYLEPNKRWNRCYPVGTKFGTADASGTGWSYDASTETLTLGDASGTAYTFDLTRVKPADPNSAVWDINNLCLLCNLTVGAGVKVTNVPYWIVSSDYTVGDGIHVKSGGKITGGSLIGCRGLTIEQGGEVSGVTFTDKEIINEGTMKNCRINNCMDTEDGIAYPVTNNGTMEGCIINCGTTADTLTNDGTIQDSFVSAAAMGGTGAYTNCLFSTQCPEAVVQGITDIRTLTAEDGSKDIVVRMHALEKDSLYEVSGTTAYFTGTPELDVRFGDDTALQNIDGDTAYGWTGPDTDGYYTFTPKSTTGNIVLNKLTYTVKVEGGWLGDDQTTTSAVYGPNETVTVNRRSTGSNEYFKGWSVSENGADIEFQDGNGNTVTDLRTYMGETLTFVMPKLASTGDTLTLTAEYKAYRTELVMTDEGKPDLTDVRKNVIQDDDGKDKYEYFGDMWRYTVDPSDPTDPGILYLEGGEGDSYDFSSTHPRNPSAGTPTTQPVTCTIDSNSKITGGIFDGEVINDDGGGTIRGGTYNGLVTSYRTIEDGTFKGTVENYGGTISDGTFKGTVQNWYGTISGGTFKGTVLNSNGEISGGTFAAGLSRNFNTVTGGVFNGNANLTRVTGLHSIAVASHAKITEVNGVSADWAPYVVVTSDATPTTTEVTITADTDILSLNGKPIGADNCNSSYVGGDKKTVTFTMPDADVVLNRTAELEVVDGRIVSGETASGSGRVLIGSKVEVTTENKTEDFANWTVTPEGTELLYDDGTAVDLTRDRSFSFVMPDVSGGKLTLTAHYQAFRTNLLMNADGTVDLEHVYSETIDGNQTCKGDGWHVMNRGTLTLEKGTYDFRYMDPVAKTGELEAVTCSIWNKGGIVENGVFRNLVLNEDGGTITGGTFAAGLYEFPGIASGTVTGGVFNGNVALTNARHVTMTNGSLLKVNGEDPLSVDMTDMDENPPVVVTEPAWDLYSYAGTTVTITADTDILSLNGKPIGADNCSSSYVGGDKKTVTFTMPDADVVLNDEIDYGDLVMENGYPVGSNGGTTACKGDGWQYIPNDPTYGNVLLLTGSNQTNGLYDFSAIADGAAVECNVFVGKPTAITGGVFNGTVFNNSGILGGIFNGPVTNTRNGTIVNGTFNEDVENNGAIEEGTFNGGVTNNNTISNGAFTGEVTNNETGAIENGSFGGTVKNAGAIENGTFNGAVNNTGTINGGTYNGAVTSTGMVSDSITGSGTLNGEPITKTPAPDPAPGPDDGKEDPEPTPTPDPTPSEPEQPSTPEQPEQPTTPDEPEVPTYTVTVIGGTINGQTSVSAKENDTLTVVLDPNEVPDGMTFDLWSISSNKLSGDINVDYRAEAMTFQMPAEDVTIRAQYRSAEIIEDSAPSPLATAATIAVGGAAAGIVVWQGVNLGVDAYLANALPKGVPVPTNRRALALLLWETAGKPEVALPAFYGDISAEEIELQKATHWAIQNGLMDEADKKDASRFDPDHYVTKMDVFGAWLKLKKLLGTN